MNKFKPLFVKHGFRSKFNHNKNLMTPQDDKHRNIRRQSNTSNTNKTIKEKFLSRPINISNHNFFDKTRRFTVQSGDNNRQKFKKSQISQEKIHSRSPNGKYDNIVALNF